MIVIAGKAVLSGQRMPLTLPLPAGRPTPSQTFIVRPSRHDICDTNEGKITPLALETAPNRHENRLQPSSCTLFYRRPELSMKAKAIKRGYIVISEWYTFVNVSH